MYSESSKDPISPSMRRFGKPLGAGLITLFLCTSAMAGNDDEVLVGGDAVMTGGAVTATVRDGSALWYNPAGLGGSGKHQVDVSGSAYTLRIWNIPEYLSGPDGQVAAGDTIEAVTIPSAMTYVREVDEKWAIGFGYFLSRWSDIRGHSTLGFEDGDEQASWQAGYSSTYSLHNAALGASYRADSTLRFGVALMGFYNGIAVAEQFSGGLSSGADSAFSTVSLLGAHKHAGLQLQGGVKWRPIVDVELGASIRTPGVALYNSYDVQGNLTGAFDPSRATRLQAGGEARELYYRTVDLEDSNLKPDWHLPARFRLGVAHHLGKSWWSFDVDVQPGVSSRPVTIGSSTGQAVNRATVINARLGGKYALQSGMLLGLGLFSDRGSKRVIKLGEAEFDFYGVAAGLEMGNAHSLKETERADKIKFSTTIGVRYAYGIGQMGTIAVPYFYDAIASDPQGDIDVEIQKKLTDATAHELTFNLGAGLYF